MEVLYLDSLFALNFVIDYCIVLASARVCGVVLRRWRYALSALIGAVYACVMVLPGCAWLGGTVMKLVLGVVLSLTAFGGEARFWRCTGVFFAVSALFGGAVFAASLLAGTDALGGAFVSVSGRVLALSFGVCYAAVSLLFRRRLKHTDRTVRTVAVTVGNKTFTLRGLVDSGNSLHDPVTGQDAAIVHAAALSLPCCDNAVAAVDALRDLPGIRLLPYAAVGVERALLAAFRPDRVTVDGVPRALLIALSPAPLSAEGAYEAILPPE